MADADLMQAIRFYDYGGPEQFVLERAPAPQPGPGTVLVRVRAAGVNPVDWKIRAGRMKEFQPIPLPAIPGRDLAGVIEAIGSGVSGFRQGQAVYGMADSGSYAEHAVVSIKNLALKPERLSFEETATVPVGAVTAWRALFDAAQLQAGQRILIQGAAGGVGLFVAQFARWKGAHVTGTASAANQDFLRSLGVEKAIDYGATRVEREVHDMDVVIDTVGGDVLQNSYQLVRPGGILVTIAGQPDQAAASGRGIRVARVGPAADASGILQQVGNLIDSGLIRAFVGKVMPLAAAAEAHRLSETGHGRGHIVLKVDGQG